MTPIQATIYIMRAMENHDIGNCSIELAGTEWRFVITKELHAAGTHVQTSFSVGKTAFDDADNPETLLAPMVADAIACLIDDIHILCEGGTLCCRFCEAPLVYMDDSTMACANCVLAAQHQIVLNIPPKPVTQPTQEGVCRYPPDGRYTANCDPGELGTPCRCVHSCPQPCKGQCGCEACSEAYGDFLSTE